MEPVFALGAQRRQILALVVAQGMRMAAAGLLLGIVAAVALARLVASQLFQVRAFDPITLGVMAATILLVALLAIIIPARRATNVDPLDACRHE